MAGDGNWVFAANAGEFEEDDPKQVKLGDEQLALFKVGDDIYATSDICTHAYACLSEGFQDGDTIECPIHQGIFEISTGKALEGPIEVDLKTYPVRLDGDKVMVDLGG